MGACAQKKRDDSFHYEEQVSPVQRDEFLYMPLWSIKEDCFLPINWLLLNSFHLGGYSPPSALSRHIVLPAYDHAGYDATNRLARVYKPISAKTSVS